MLYCAAEVYDELAKVGVSMGSRFSTSLAVVFTWFLRGGPSGCFMGEEASA